jgi:kynurenine 3-monooxygenase
LNPHVTILGAGLSGALMAIYLARTEREVVLYERRPDIRKVDMDAGRSINLALADRGIHALKQADVFDDVEPLLIPMRGRVLHDLEGGLTFVPYGQRPHEVIYSVSRPPRARCWTRAPLRPARLPRWRAASTSSDELVMLDESR